MILLSKNGRIIDGTGKHWYRGDITIRGDRIAKIGNLPEKKTAWIIDALSHIVCPGFIDVHTHCDSSLGQPEMRANLNYPSQGVTTVVTVNCSQGPRDLAETVRSWRENGIGTNTILLVGFGTIRREVIGTEDRPPTK